MLLRAIQGTVLLFAISAGAAVALSIVADEVEVTIEEAHKLGIEITFDSEDPRCGGVESLEVSAPPELDSESLLAAMILYTDQSGDVIFLEDQSKGSLCPRQEMDYILFMYGGGATRAVYTRIKVNARTLTQSYNKPLKYVPGLSALHRTRLRAPLS